MSSLERHDDYPETGLEVADLDDDPVTALAAWLTDAEDAGIREPNALVLGTVASDGAPSSRTVLLKGFPEGRLEFVTNGDSRKGHELAGDGRVSILFPWYQLHRQVRVEGVAERAPEALSDGYWATRPRGSQIGGWASSQSQPIATREGLAERVAEEERRFEGVAVVPRPPHWGAYLVTPTRIEFWQGRSSRLHDRLLFERADAVAAAATGWTVTRLQP